jgi:predicted acyltransferase (DUF342 family)
MSYTITVTNHSPITIATGASDTSTALTLIGKNVPSYGQTIAQNFVKLMQNFASTDEPNGILDGQLWYDTSTGLLKLWNGLSYKVLSAISSQTTTPTTGEIGDFWWDTTNSQLKIYDSANWVTVGPYTTISPIILDTISDNSSNDRSVSRMTVGGVNVAAISSATFTARSSYAGFTNIIQGMMITGGLTMTGSQTVGGTQAVTGSQTVGGTQTVTGASTIGGNQVITGNISVGGIQTVTGNSTVTGSQTIGGTQTVTGNSTVNGSLIVAGQIYASGGLSGAVTGNQIITGNLTVQANLAVSQNVTISQNLTVTGTATLTASNAKYADLAEYYTSDEEYEAGTVVMIGGSAEVTAANIVGTTKVVGVVSANPAYLMNSDCEGVKVAVALQGRIPCKVMGRVERGDMLIASNIPGVAISIANANAGSIIGKALQSRDEDGMGIIEIIAGKH